MTVVFGEHVEEVVPWRLCRDWGMRLVEGVTKILEVCPHSMFGIYLIGYYSHIGPSFHWTSNKFYFPFLYAGFSENLFLKKKRVSKKKVKKYNKEKWRT